MLVQASNSKVLDMLWFSGTKTVGIALTENAQGERRFYIGGVPGLDEKSDMIQIANFGNKIDPGMMIDFLKNGQIKKLGEMKVTGKVHQP